MREYLTKKEIAKAAKIPVVTVKLNVRHLKENLNLDLYRLRKNCEIRRVLVTAYLEPWFKENLWKMKLDLRDKGHKDVTISDLAGIALMEFLDKYYPPKKETE